MKMGAPYRDAGIPSAEIEHVDDGVKPLASYVVSGRAGQRGLDGHRGANGSGSGAYGAVGGHAGPAEVGQDAGTIRLELQEDAGGIVAMRGERVAADGQREPIHGTLLTIDEGFIELHARGGGGGDGGNGGDGGDGARGRAGADATRWSNGDDGGPGGGGGDGGNATSGARGGRGGSITVAVSDEDTPLLMLVQHDVLGGNGGKPGRNGRGGAGGPGGPGGDSYSWTTTSSYKDSNGNTQTTTHYHRNPGGSRGPSGSSGRSGSATVTAGAQGPRGAFAIEVNTADGVKTYSSRYDLRLVDFAHDNANADHVYEPGELVKVFDVEVENVGGMPTPAKDDLRLSLIRDGWVLPEPGDLVCPPSLPAGARHTLAGSLTFRIKDHTPEGPGDPLEVEESILHRAVLPAVRRGFDDYQTEAALDAGKFVIRYPVRASAIQNLRSLAAGETTRVRFSLVNQSRHALGAQSDSRRVVRVRIATAPDSDLDDEHVVLVAGDREIKPSEGWTHDVPLLGAGDQLDLELMVRVRDGAPDYRRFAAQLCLELGKLDVPSEPRPIQLRAFDVRVARPFRGEDVDLLLVVNHKTTREEVIAWEALANDLACKVAIWDLTRERHLDLETPVAGDRTLRDLLGRGSILILDNGIDGSAGPTYPHAFVCPEQALRAAAAGIDIAFLGKGVDLHGVLVPTASATGTNVLERQVRTAEDTSQLLALTRDHERVDLDVFRRYWLRWWATPEQAWLSARAHELSDELVAAHAAQRHLVVPEFKPELESRFLWMKRWRVGTLKTLRTLNAAEGALLRVELTDEQVHDPAYAVSRDGTTALLLLLDFDDKLERLRKLGEAEAPSADMLGHVVELLLVDLADELVAMAAPRWRAGASNADLERGLPCLRTLAAAGLRAEYTSPLGEALLLLASRLEFLARSQVSAWEAFTPFRWSRRAPALATLVRDHVERFLVVAFGAHNLNTALGDVRAAVKALAAEHAADERGDSAPSRGEWALERFRGPLSSGHVTSDVELLTTTHARVLEPDTYAEVLRAKAQARELRERLLSDAGSAHAALIV